jgi:hypothetical protein
MRFQGEEGTGQGGTREEITINRGGIMLRRV